MFMRQAKNDVGRLFASQPGNANNGLAHVEYEAWYFCGLQCLRFQNIAAIIVGIILPIRRGLFLLMPCFAMSLQNSFQHR